jgi:hypothetical protein
MTSDYSSRADGSWPEAEYPRLDVADPPPAAPKPKPVRVWVRLTGDSCQISSNGMQTGVNALIKSFPGYQWMPGLKLWHLPITFWPELETGLSGLGAEVTVDERESGDSERDLLMLKEENAQLKKENESLRKIPAALRKHKAAILRLMDTI